MWRSGRFALDLVKTFAAMRAAGKAQGRGQS
jgi:hypothetical protein